MEQPQLQALESDAKSSNADEEGMTEMSLREHLLAAQAAGQIQPHHDQYRSEDPSNPQGHLNNDIGPSPYGSVGVDMGGHMMLDVDHKGKRELSSSKRAAQNRAAQRAFRQRKEGYIKKLEDQVRSFSALQESHKAVQNENYQLREYVLGLQSRLVELEGDYPPPPPSIDLQHSRSALVEHDLSELQDHLAGASDVGRSGEVPTAPMGSSAASQLARAAVQAGEYVAADLERRQNEENDRSIFMSTNADLHGSPKIGAADKTDLTDALNEANQADHAQA